MSWESSSSRIAAGLGVLIQTRLVFVDILGNVVLNGGDHHVSVDRVVLVIPVRPHSCIPEVHIGLTYNRRLPVRSSSSEYLPTGALENALFFIFVCIHTFRTRKFSVLRAPTYQPEMKKPRRTNQDPDVSRLRVVIVFIARLLNTRHNRVRADNDCFHYLKRNGYVLGEQPA